VAVGLILLAVGMLGRRGAAARRPVTVEMVAARRTISDAPPAWRTAT
jgi:hypothetical protein